MDCTVCEGSQRRKRDALRTGYILFNYYVTNRSEIWDDFNILKNTHFGKWSILEGEDAQVAQVS